MRHSRSSIFGLVLLVLGVSVASSWWAGRAKERIGEQVATLAAPGDIRMLSSDTCGICAEARSWFDANQIAFSECSIERDAACRAAFDATRSPGTPVLLVRGSAQVGFDRQRLLSALERPG
ncbi:MAG: hypothetical protein M3Y32_02400 [Pseudomonadota bacterium]|nr:hypothetical protein [Pseudomonadota bacterium]